MKIEDYDNIKINNISNVISSPMEIYELTNQLLTDYYLTFGKMDDDASIPIEGIVNWLGFQIVSMDINMYSSNKSSFSIARLNGEEKIIYVASDNFFSLSKKRFAIAKMLGHYILSDRSSTHFREFNFRLDEADYAAEVFASFILVPPTELLRFMNNYYESNRKKLIDLEKYLSEASAFYKIPFMQMVVAFEHIRTLFINVHSRNENDLEDNRFSDLRRLLKNNVPNFLY